MCPTPPEPPARPSSVRPRALAEVFAPLPSADSSALGDILVSGVNHDSRFVAPGDLYAALPGGHTHGARFAAAAVAAGAAAVLTDPAGARIAGPLPVPVVTTPEPRAVLGAVADLVYGRPSRRLAVYGVTGTNGKTTTSYLLDAGLRAAGRRTGLVGTVATRIGDETMPSTHTTPEAPELQALLAVMAERDLDAVSMEVSSHALALRRVDGTRFRVAAFTNLSQDHLDFHGSMGEYYRAKARLFGAEFTDRAVIDVDDPAGRRLAGEVRAAGGVSVSTVSESAGDWRIEAASYGPTGSQARLRAPDGSAAPLRVALPGPYNLRNAALAVAALVVGGEELPDVLEGVASLAGVPGRMEPVRAGQPFLALVDYAHTPEALHRLLSAVRAVTTGAVLVVVGCGGDRDRGKRPLMSRAAVEGADRAVFTSDNPRSEEPSAILEEMLAGLADRSVALVEPDRRQAIRAAVRLARPGDTVVVAGKGHEAVQEFADRTVAFDDRQVLREEIELAGLADTRR